MEERQKRNREEREEMFTRASIRVLKIYDHPNRSSINDLYL